MLHFIFKTSLFATTCFVCTSFGLTKTDAYQTLQSNGFRWKLTDTLPLDARAKTESLESNLNPKAELVLRQFVAKINPITYGLKNDDSIESLGLGTTAIAASWTIVDLATRAQIKGSLENEKVARFQSENFKNDLTALMLIQFLTAQRLKSQIQSMDANLEKSQFILKLANAKSEVGAGIPLDITRAKNLVELDRIKKMQTMTKFMKARHDLGITLGLEKIDDDVDALVAKKIAHPTLASTLDSAMENRADLKSANFAVEAANFGREETSNSFWPKLSVFAEAGTTRSSFLGLPAQNANYSMGFSLTVPLDSGGFLTAKRHEAEVFHVKASLNKDQTRIEILSQVEEAISQLTNAEEALTASEQYLKMAQEEARISEEKFNAGSGNSLDLRSSHTNLIAAEDTHLEGIYAYEAAKVNYFRVTGNFKDYFELERAGPL